MIRRRTCIAVVICAVSFGSTHAGAEPTDWQARLEEYEVRLSAATTEKERFEALGLVAFAAKQARALGRAREVTLESLALAEKYRDSWAYGNSVHKGHLMLGEIALEAGDIEVAKKELLAAGVTPGSPQLNSFGPSMALAKALLELGERETVVRYLDACRVFWEMGRERIDEWKLEILAGRTPDFGANLVY